MKTRFSLSKPGGRPLTVSDLRLFLEGIDKAGLSDNARLKVTVKLNGHVRELIAEEGQP